MNITEEEVKKYTRELDKILKTFDTNRMRKFVYKHQDIIPHSQTILIKDDEWLKGMMAKMIMNRTTMDGNTRYQAVQILMKLGWSTELWN